MKLFPLPNFVDPDPARRQQWNYISSASGTYPRHTETLRLDYVALKNLLVYARVSRVADKQSAPYGHWATAR